MGEQAQREAALRREWAGKTKAAEWALKAHRDKQVCRWTDARARVLRDTSKKSGSSGVQRALSKGAAGAAGAAGAPTSSA